jgi:hypothetical protein
MSDPDFRLLPPRLDRADSLRNVESLGVSCELGLVQRHCEVEPPGLFRFGYTPVAGLIEALDNGFQGLGDPALIDIAEDSQGEWITTHRRYGFEFHTAHQASRHTREFVLAKLSPYFDFLGRKLIEDIEQGEKLFVYRAEARTDRGGAAEDLSRAIARRGPAVLLWVMVAPAPDLAGRAHWVAPGRLMHGYLDRFAEIRFAAGASYDCWLTLVENALALQRGDLAPERDGATSQD